MSKEKYWIYGKHPVISAINNPNRVIHQIVATKNQMSELDSEYKISEISPKDLSKLLPHDAVHQGVAALVSPLPNHELESIKGDSVLILDEITDPHNIGAILRSASAFGISAVITTTKNFPKETAVVAKVSSGALDIVPIIRVANLVNAIDFLKKNDYWVVGLDGKATYHLNKVSEFNKVALIAGAEGKGLRNLTVKNCDILVKIPISNIESLNVSNAVAISLYELRRKTE